MTTRVGGMLDTSVLGVDEKYDSMWLSGVLGIFLPLRGRC